MNSEFLPYGRHNVNDEDIKKVIEVLKSDYLTQGKVHKEFENQISKKVKSGFCVSFNSATSALHIACLALGLGKGDILWTSPITFVASANCARFCNADVDFVDIDEKTGLMSVSFLEEKLVKAEKDKKLPKIVVPVHLAGSSCNMLEIYKLSKKYGFHIIEDASHALGGECNKYPVGSCEYSDITIFSLHPVKMITSAEGGLATTNSVNLYSSMRSFANHGIIRDKNKFLGNSFESWRYEQQTLGFNFRLSDVHAALGLSQLKRLDTFVKERNKIANVYMELLATLPIRFLSPYSFVKSSYHLFVIQLINANREVHENLFNYLKINQIGVQLHYLPVHLQPYYKELGFHEGLFPCAEKYAISSISLPIFPSLKIEEIKKVISHLNYFFNL